MNELEDAITAALGAEAEGAAMTTDTARESARLEARLDVVDARRRARTWVLAVAAAAAAIAVVAIAVIVRGAPATSVPPASTSSPSAASESPSYTTTTLNPTVSLALPPGIAGARSLMTSESPYAATWRAADCADACPESVVVLYVRRVLTAPGLTDREDPVGTSQQFLAHLDGLAQAGVVALPRRESITVSGFAATLLTVDGVRASDGGLGCLEVCADVAPGQQDRVAVLDLDGRTLLVGMSTSRSNANRAALERQFEQMLETVRIS